MLALFLFYFILLLSKLKDDSVTWEGMTQQMESRLFYLIHNDSVMIPRQLQIDPYPFTIDLNNMHRKTMMPYIITMLL